MSDLPTSPQLHMLRPHLRAAPALDLPEGYSLRMFLPGDGPHWSRIIGLSFETDPEQVDFNQIMRAAPAFRPERIFFVCRGEEPVATASAWYHPELTPDAGTVHYVGTLPGHTGQRLGYWAVVAALHRMLAEGRRRAWLSTDDFRLPAIKVYLNLGFQPLLVHENQRQRWPAVFEKLGVPHLTDTFADILAGPLWEKPAPTPDAYNYAGRVTRRWRWLPDRPAGRPNSYDIDALGDESLYHPAALGTVSVSPTSVDAGADQPFTLTYTVGPAGVQRGSVVRIEIPGQQPLGGRIQWDAPDTPGFLRVDGPAYAVLTPAGLGFTVTEGALREGDVVRLSVGEGHGFAWTPLAGRKELNLVIRTSELEPAQRLPEPTVVRVRPCTAERLEVLLPVSARPETSVRATVSVRDQYDNRVPWDGPVTLRAGARETTAYLRDGLGYADIRLDHEPLQVDAQCALLPDASTSNVCRPSVEQQLFIGDMHAHDLTCPAEGYTADVYRWARDDKRLDFLSVPVQGHAFLDNEKWLLAKYHAQTFLDEGHFVTFLATEWQHSHYGDKVIHFLGNDAPPLPVDDPRYAGPASLYEALRGTDAFIISHHPGYALDQHIPGTDWDAVETDVERLVELWSMHGSSEGFDPADRPLRLARREDGVREALRRGLRLGFTAGSDTHSGRPGGSVKEVFGYWGGLCAVWAERLTRRSLYEAFRARRTYALTGERIGLRFTVNGAPMGADIPAAATYHLQVDAWAPSPIAAVQWMRNGELLDQSAVYANTANLALYDTGTPTGPLCYHCRVVLRNGHLAVCSPVWVNRALQ